MESLRIDKWLWHARFVKSRSLAQTLIDEGAVTLNGRVVAKSSATVKAGDVLQFAIRDWVRTVTVVGLGERRGPAAEAALLYEQTSEVRKSAW